MNIVYKLSHKQIMQLHRLYKNEWWTRDRTLKDTESVVKNSSIVIGITDNDNNLIAFARVLSDYTFKALIFDVIVDHNFRGDGLGKKIMKLVLEHKDLRNVRSFELYCLEDMIDFYDNLGFKYIETLKLLKMDNRFSVQ